MAIKGVQDIVVVELKKDDETGVTYAADLKKLIGAKEVGIDPQLSEGELEGDDKVLETESSISALNVTVDIAKLTLEEQAFLTGQKIVEGTLISSSDDAPPEMGLGFKAALSELASGGYRRVWLLKGKTKPIKDDYKGKTKGAVDYQTPKMDCVFTPRIHDNLLKLTSDSNAIGAVTDEEFFSTEYLNKMIGDITVKPGE